MFNLCREVIFKSTSQFRIIWILSRSRAFDDDHFHHCHFLISVTIISDTKCQDFQRNTPVEESICDQYYSHAQSPEVYRLFLKYIQTTAQDDLMNQNCLIHISHAPARSLDRAQQSPKLWWWRRRWERRWWHWRWWYWWSGNNDGWGLSDEPVSSYSHTHTRRQQNEGNKT